MKSLTIILAVLMAGSVLITILVLAALIIAPGY